MHDKTVLILISHYLPGTKIGGPLSSLCNLIDHLSSEIRFNVLTLDRDLGDKLPYKDISTNRWIEKEGYSIYYLKKNIFFLFKLIHVINRTKFDYIYINSFFDSFFSIFILWAIKFKLIKSDKVIIATRGELFEEALKFKSLKKKIYIIISKYFRIYRNVVWHASTEIEKNNINNVFNNQTNNIKIAINLPRKSTNTKLTVTENDFSNDVLKIVYLSRISKDKNIPYVFDVLKEVSLNIIFDIYGPIEDQYIWNTCLDKKKLLPKCIKVNYCGLVDKENVTSILQKYDLFFLPTFAENYGHAIVESLSVGTPVLISNNTPWQDLASKGFGWDINLKQLERFVEAINYLGKKSVLERYENRKRIIIIFGKMILNDEVLLTNKQIFEN